MKNYENKVATGNHLKKSIVAMLFCLCFLNTIMAQHNWNLSFRGAADFPTKKLGDATLKSGFGGEATIGYQLLPNLAIYAGWGWNKFNTDNLFNNPNIDIEETGYRVGLRFASRLGDSKFKYLIGAGGLYNHIELENSAGEITEDSGHGFGWQADVGIVIPLGKRFNLTPTVRYQSLNRDLNNGSIATSVDLNYISTGLEFSFLF